MSGGPTGMRCVRLFSMECVAAVKEYVRSRLPLGRAAHLPRIPGGGPGDPGLTVDEVADEISPKLQDMGVAWILRPQAELGHTPKHAFPPLDEPRGVYVKFAERVKQKVSDSCHDMATVMTGIRTFCSTLSANLTLTPLGS